MLGIRQVLMRSTAFGMMVVLLGLGLTSCADSEPKPVGPTTETSKIPWNKPIGGQGQGQFGMMRQNQYRR